VRPQCLPMPDPISELLGRARRRLTVMLAAHSFAWVIGIAALACGMLASLARVVVLPWADTTIVVTMTVAGLVALAIVVQKRPSIRRTSIEIDNRLGGYDRVSTAVERLSDSPVLSDVERTQVNSATAWANGRSLDGFGPVLVTPAILFLAALALAGLVVLVVAPSSADAIANEREAMQALIDEEADALEELSEELPEEVAEELRAIVEELRAAETLEEALAKLAEARQTLSNMEDPNELAKKTALAGLAARLAQQPLSNGGSLEESLAAIAESLAGATEEEKAALAQELADRADDFAGIDNQLAQALDNASSALASGGAPDLATVGEAAARTSADVSTSEAAGAASAAVAESQRMLSDAAAQGQGDGQGDGQGEGAGAGQGEGAGEGQGAGQGQGTGQGQGAGGGGGGQGGAGTSPGATNGGTGSGSLGRGGFSDEDPLAGPVRGDIVDAASVTSNDEVRVDIFGNLLGNTVGSAEGTGLANTPSVSYQDVFEQYRAEALDSLGGLTVPLSLQDIVNSYFTELEP